jgi:DNA mismatch repair protein MutL
MPIKVLTAEVISKIAAGEVIERPASVVKELIENSLDAQATEVVVEVENGGIDLIKVSDNGVGIPAAEVELAFHRYATSKVSSLEDLEHISTLGFRGEALPSIAAVAEVEISTAALGEPVGSYLRLRRGGIVDKRSRARPQGTTVTVRGLFRYFPARLKFLKSPSTENGHIAQVVSQYALAFTETKFTLTLDKRLSLCTPGDGDLRHAVNQVYGSELAENMLPVERQDDSVAIKGLVSPPWITRSNRNYLSFFVNRRWVRSPLLTQAVEEAYSGLLGSGQHPVAIVNISVPPREIDVNIHPAKALVKFCRDQVIFTNVRKAVENALSGAAKANPIRTSFALGSAAQEPAFIAREREPIFSVSSLPTMELPVLRVLGQLAHTYIIAEGPDGLYLIDQHAAHERILYEKILAQRAERKIEIQGLLQPITVELTPHEEEILRVNLEYLAQFGFSLEPFGRRDYLVRTIPAMASGANVIEIMSAILDDLAGRENSLPWEERIARSLACHGAIKAGQQLSSEEMRELIMQLEQTKQPRSCPHGRPTMIHLSSERLEKEFGRMS